MVVNLCRNVEALAKRQLRKTGMPQGNSFKHRAAIYQIYPFLNKLGKADLEAFWKYATHSSGKTPLDDRSRVITLENPIVADGKTIKALRLKGVYPFAENGKVAPYSSGAGFVQNLLIPCGGTKIKLVENKDTANHAAYGSMNMERLKQEVTTALTLGKELTDIALGFGIFEDLSYLDKPVGFAIYGMERETDTRLGNEFSSAPDNWRFPKQQPLVEDAGLRLKKAIEAGFAFGYPVSWNFAVHSPQEIRIVDLDTSVNTTGLSREERITYAYLDLGIAMQSYYIGVSERGDVINMTPLLPHLLWGFFRGDSSLKFVRQIEKYYRGNCNEKEITARSSPFYFGAANQGPSYTKPMLDLYWKKEIDLKNYYQTGYFRYFMQAIESVV